VHMGEEGCCNLRSRCVHEYTEDVSCFDLGAVKVCLS
jgi:hypothetical protein